MVPNLMHLGWTVRRVKVCSVSSLSSNCTSLFQDRICGRRELITREGAGRLKTSLSTRSTTQPHKESATTAQTTTTTESGKWRPRPAPTLSSSASAMRPRRPPSWFFDDFLLFFDGDDSCSSCESSIKCANSSAGDRINRKKGACV